MTDNETMTTTDIPELDLGPALEETFGPPGGAFEEAVEKRQA
jgi:hypothetical protein